MHANISAMQRKAIEMEIFLCFFYTINERCEWFYEGAFAPFSYTFDYLNENIIKEIALVRRRHSLAIMK